MAITAIHRKHGTLVAATEANPTLVTGGNPPKVRVTSHATSDIYCRADGTAATVKGNGCYVALPGQSVLIPSPTPAVDTGVVTLSLISAGTPDYTVEFAEA